MRRVWLLLVLLTACVDVPAGIKANFAEPGPNDRSNFRPGNHGTAQPPAEVPAPTAKAAEVDAGPTAEQVAEGGVQ